MSNARWLPLRMALLAALTACGGDPSVVGSCRIDPGRCADYGQGFTAAAAMGNCATGPSQVFSTSACPSANRTGRCTTIATLSTGGSLTLVVSYYAPYAASAAQMLCTAMARADVLVTFQAD